MCMYIYIYIYTHHIDCSEAGSLGEALGLKSRSSWFKQEQITAPQRGVRKGGSGKQTLLGDLKVT